MTSLGALAVKRLHPSLLVHTAQVDGARRLVAQTSASRPPLVIRHPLALSALALLPARFDRPAAGSVWAQAIPERQHDDLWSALLEAEVIVDEDSRLTSSWWSRFGWQEAAAYHCATRDYPFIQMSDAGAWAQDADRMQSYRTASAPPSVYRQRARLIGIALDRLHDRCPDELMAGMSEDERLGRPGLGLLLDVCFGARGTVETAGGVNCLLKSVPSGGARHPTEVYVASLGLEGVPAGTYHYNVEHHRLDLLDGEDHRDAYFAATYDLASKHARPPSALLVFTSVVERAMWRYRDPRSFRAILVDVGHAVAAYRRAARLLGFRTYASQKFGDRLIAGLIDVDPVIEPPLYVASLTLPGDG